MPCRLLVMTRLMSACAGVERALGDNAVAARTSREVASPKRLAACNCSVVIPPMGGGAVGEVPDEPLRRPLPRPLLPDGSGRASAFTSTLAATGFGSGAGGGVATGAATGAGSPAGALPWPSPLPGGRAGLATVTTDGLRRSATATMPQTITARATAPMI